MSKANIYEVIERVNRSLNREYPDVYLASFVLKDLPEVKKYGLDTLAWVLYKGYPSKNDVIGLIELLEKGLRGEILEVEEE